MSARPVRLLSCFALLGSLLGGSWETPAALATVLLNDGGVHVVDTALPNPGGGAPALAVRDQGCSLLDDPCPVIGTPTQVTFESGGDADLITVHDTSSLIQDGGILREVDLYDQASITILDGPLGETITLHDEATGSMSGGGAIGNSLVVAGGESDFLMTGGFLDSGLVVTDDGVATMEGGSLGEGFGASGNGVLYIVGEDFAIDGMPVGYGPVAATSGQLTGTLLSGEPFGTAFGFSTSDNGQIILVPEPMMGTLLAWGILGLGYLRRRA